ncbi:MAG: apolipoprotein N-acyltransferase [Propionibacteriaceae bacterium]|nr:apolipoprotein N-acyltransferase [Propionibacteriaceae bacterium]
MLNKKPLWLRVLLAVLAALAGVATSFAFAPYSLWPLALVGTCALSVIVWQARALWGAALYGWAFGLGFMFVGIGWMQVIFPEALFALAGFMSLWYALLGWLIKLAQRSNWWPLLAAGAWTAIEAAFSRVPFGGFGWMRLGYSQIDSWFAGGYPLVGTAIVGFFVALIGNVVAWLILKPSLRSGWVSLGTVLAVLLVCVLGGSIQPEPTKGDVNVGWAQGGAPGGGVYGLGPARTITKDEAEQTKELADDVAAGVYPKPAFVVWPENGTDLDPAKDQQTMDYIKRSLAEVGVPMLIGSIAEGPGENERQTVSYWWLPDGNIDGSYVKRGIVPFGEWVPLRDILEPLFPKLSYVGRQSVAGDVPGVIPVVADGRELDLGILICYDVSFDSYVYDLGRYGADIAVVQSSNAMYQGTTQIEQQFAITRVRAAELRREILVVTTSGISGYIDSRGNVVEKITDSGGAHGVQTIPIRDSATPVLWLGPILEIAVSVISVLLILMNIKVSSRHGKRKGK